MNAHVYTMHRNGLPSSALAFPLSFHIDKPQESPLGYLMRFWCMAWNPGRQNEGLYWNPSYTSAESF
jgi:hypothetical protein